MTDSKSTSGTSELETPVETASSSQTGTEKPDTKQDSGSDRRSELDDAEPCAYNSSGTGKLETNQGSGFNPKNRLDQVKTSIDIVQGIATVIALVLGGFWFLGQRPANPNIKLDQTVTWQRVEGDTKNLLHVAIDVRATNIGKVKVDLKPGLIKVFEINPEVSPLFELPLSSLRLEPGESAQALFHVQPMYDSVKAIEIVTCYEVPGSGPESLDCEHRESLHLDPPHNNLYWSLVSVAEIGTDAAQKQSSTSAH